MAIIKQQSAVEEEEKKTDPVLETKEEVHQNADTFEEVQAAKARLFHSQKEAFDIWGIKKHLVVIIGSLAAFAVCAFLPILTKIEDTQALVVPAQMVNIEALKEGKITDVFVKEGESVQKGQVLARITSFQDEKDLVEAKNQSKLLEAQLAVLDAKRIYSFERYEQDKALLDQKVISRDELLNTELSFKTLEKEREVLAAQLTALKEKLSLLEEEKKQGAVLAPVSGIVISDIQEKVGNYVSKGKFLLTLASPEQRLEFFLAEEDHGRVEVGDSAKIKFYPFPNRVFRGRVIALKHYAEPVDKHGFKKNFIKVLIAVEDFPQGIRNGMTAKVMIQGRSVSLFNGIQRRIG
jgi:multidrug resistance efflux pump